MAGFCNAGSLKTMHDPSFHESSQSYGDQHGKAEFEKFRGFSH
jgi:hypothetical protein